MPAIWEKTIYWLTLICPSLASHFFWGKTHNDVVVGYVRWWWWSFRYQNNALMPFCCLPFGRLTVYILYCIYKKLNKQLIITAACFLSLISYCIRFAINTVQLLTTDLQDIMCHDVPLRLILQHTHKYYITHASDWILYTHLYATHLDLSLPLTVTFL